MVAVTPLSPAVGAVVDGIDIAAGVSDQEFAELYAAFVAHGVVFLRNQDFTPDQHREFALRWSAININRFFQPVDGHPDIAEVRKEPDQKLNIGSQWHTDHSYDQIPALGSILYAKEVPELGGDTLFASQCAAFEALSGGLQEQLLQMRAKHSSRHVFGAVAYTAEATDDVSSRLGNTAAAVQDAIHPVIIEHPLSGRPALYVNADFTTRFDGWSRTDSQPLLDHLYDHAHRDEFTCRFSWEPGSVAIWDNRAVQHSAVNDYHGHRRLMHRITLEGVALSPADPRAAARCQ